METPEKTKISVVASFKRIDAEGNKVIETFPGFGTTVKEALEDAKLPKGVNSLVMVKASNGKKDYEIALAPHKARAIFDNADEIVFKSVFGF